MDTADSPVALRLARSLVRQFNWRGCAAVLGLCLVLSTEILFTPATFEHWTLRQIADGWLEQLFDTVSLGMFIMVSVKLTDSMVGEAVRWRLLALLAAVVVAAGAGYLGLTALHYPAGYYPPTMVLVGETLRVALLGGIATTVWTVRRSNARSLQRLRLMQFQRGVVKQGLLDAEIKVLEAQIEPHFLLNTLATVRCLFRTGSGSAAQMLCSLQQYLGAALPQFRGEHPTLGSEFAQVAAYLDILQVRMGPRLAFDIALPPDLAAAPFPPMTLMTLVENAVKHGLMPLPGGGRIDVAARASGDQLEVTVSDNGAGFQAGGGSGIGLVNIQARLAVLYGGKARLALEANTPRGVVARICVPLAGPAPG